MRNIRSGLLIVFLLHFFYNTAYSQVDCGNNAGFEAGSPGGWTCKYGTYGATIWSGVCPTTGPNICPTFPTNLATTGILNTNGINAPLNTAVDRHTIMTMAYSTGGTCPLGYDSVSLCKVPVVNTGGGTYSFRLGDGVAGGVGAAPNRLARAEAIRLTFNVNSSNAGFTYNYALFLQDPGHLPEEQPRFEVSVLDSNNNIIPCGYYKYVAGSSNPYCNVGNTATLKIGGSAGDWRYTDWTSVGLDLSGYIGHPVSVEFKTSDCFPQQQIVYSVAGASTTCSNGICSWSLPTPGTTTISSCTNAPGTHSAYVYIDSYCSPISYNPLPVCTGADSVQICAPPGYKDWVWAGSNKSAECIYIQNPTPGDSFVVNMNSQSGCPTKSTVKLTGTDVLVSDTAFCAGTAGNVTLKATLTFAGNYTFLWTGPGVSSTLQNPVISIPANTSTYTINVTDTAAHCVYMKTMTINILPKPNPTISSPVTICMGGGTVLTSDGGSPGLIYSWYAGGVLVSTLNSFPVSPTSTTNYKVVISNAAGCKDSATVLITVDPAVGLTLSSDMSVCAGTTVQLTATGAPNITWQPGGASGNSITITPGVTTTYTVLGTGGTCSDTKNVTVTVNSVPVASISPPTTICSGGSTLLTSDGGAGTWTYSWYSPGLIATTSNTLVSPLNTTTYKVVISGPTGCSDSATVLITVDPAVGMSLSNDTAICSGATVQLTASGAPVITWQPGGIVGTSITITPITTTTYTVTGTGGTCTDTKMVTVTINNSIPVGITPNTAICIGGSVQLTSSGGVICSWSPGAFLDTSSSCTPLCTPLTTTTYTLTVIDGSGCLNSNTTTITVNPLPPIFGGAQPASICIGSSTTLTVTSGMAQYSWSPGPTPSNSPTPTVTPLTIGTTTYTVGVIDGFGCPNVTTIDVIVNDLPLPTAVPNASVCINAPVQLTATGGGNTTGPYTYLWNPNIGLTNTNQDTTTATPPISQAYTVTVTDGNGCSGSAVTTINVTPYLFVDATPNSDICIGDQIQLTSNSVGATNYSWDSGALTSNITVSPSITTTYTIFASNATNCNGDTTVTVTVNLLPVVTINPTATYCIGNSTQLSADGGGPGGTYTWSPNDVVPPNSAAPIASATQTTTYLVTVITAKGCKDTASTTVIVNPLPIVTVSPDTSLCLNDSTILTASGGLNYVWSPTGGLGNPNDSITVAYPQQTTPYTVTVTDTNNCSSTGTVTVNIFPPPVACDLTADICIGQLTQLDAASCANSNGSVYSWLPDFTLNPQNVSNPVANPVSTTTYTVVVWTSLNCPADTGTAVVTVHPIPSVTAGSDTTIIAGMIAQLTSVSSGTPVWSPTATLNCVFCPNPLASPLVTTMYIVTTIDSFGCSNSDTVVVNVEDILTLYVPTAFTPVSYKTVNSVFNAYGVGIWQFEFYVFDRWGALIFQTTDPTLGWDGTYKGQMVSDDVYVWLAKAKSITGKSITKTGPVTVVR